MNGKGDKPRPVDKKKFDTNHDEILWKSKTQGASADNKPLADKSSKK